MANLERMTAAHRMLRLAAELEIDFLFTNLGSDHPAFIEAMAAIEAAGGRMPQVVICPHEITTLSAAHGYSMVTRRPQLVLVHVDVGTQNLGASIHNAARSRIPAIVIAGLCPVTTGMDRVGHRTEFIHYTQDALRQHDIVSQYTKWAYELRAGEMADSVLMRGYQLASSSPQGPVYITGAREVWDERSDHPPISPSQWPTTELGGLPDEGIEELVTALEGSRRPLVLTSYLGRQPAAVEDLVKLSERLGFGVCELGPQYVNFPGRHPNHLGYRRNSHVEDADLILMIDLDVPWIMARTAPAADARLFHIDCDPTKDTMGFWNFPAHRRYRADSGQVLRQLLDATKGRPAVGREQRQAWLEAAKARSPVRTSPSSGGYLTVEQVTEAVAELVNERTVILTEVPSGTDRIQSILRMHRPGSYYANGGCGLGFSINAAIGIKLSMPEREVIALVGDGSYMMGVPSSAYWVAHAYKAPYLTVIYNNRGWNSPKLSTLLVHPQGSAQANDTYWIGVGKGARLAQVAAAAGDAGAWTVESADELRPALAAAMETVRAGRSAVVEVMLEPVSSQECGAD